MTKTTKMKRIYIDMDDTICDFSGAHKAALARVPTQRFPQAQMDFFRKLKPIDEAKTSIILLAQYYDIWFLTRPSICNPLLDQNTKCNCKQHEITK
jgi:hypothetical protein